VKTAARIGGGTRQRNEQQRWRKLLTLAATKREEKQMYRMIESNGQTVSQACIAYT
jgi:hypothetical protein